MHGVPELLLRPNLAHFVKSDAEYRQKIAEKVGIALSVAVTAPPRYTQVNSKGEI